MSGLQSIACGMDSSAGAAGARLRTRAFAVIGGIVSAVARSARQRRERRALMALDERMLADIGLRRRGVGPDVADFVPLDGRPR